MWTSVKRSVGWFDGLVRDVCDWDVSRTWHAEHVETVSLHCEAHLAGILAARNSLQTPRLNLNENSQKSTLARHVYSQQTANSWCLTSMWWFPNTVGLCTVNKHNGLMKSYFPVVISENTHGGHLITYFHVFSLDIQGKLTLVFPAQIHHRHSGFIMS